MTAAATAAIKLGLRENWRQFSLLMLVNAFVGGMVGLERTVVPLIGAEEFGIGSATIVVSFIVSFGVEWPMIAITTVGGTPDARSSEAAPARRLRKGT